MRRSSIKMLLIVAPLKSQFSKWALVKVQFVNSLAPRLTSSNFACSIATSLKEALWSSAEWASKVVWVF